MYCSNKGLLALTKSRSRQPLGLRCSYVPAQVIQHSHVCIHIVEVVGIGRVVLLCPVDWQWTVQVEDMLLRFRLIIHTVKTHDLYERPTRESWNPLRSGYMWIIQIHDSTAKTSYVLKEEMQLWMAARVDCDLKQRHEDVLQHLLKVAQLFFRVVDVTLREKYKSRSQLWEYAGIDEMKLNKGYSVVEE